MRSFIEISANRGIDEPSLVMGLPVGCQIVGGRFGEEQSIAVAKVVAKLLAEDNAKRTT